MRLARLAPVAALSLLTASTGLIAAPANAAAPTAPAAPAEAAAYDVVSDALLPDGDIGTAVMRWNPCRPIRWAINTDHAPKGFIREARQAVTELAHATGFRMVFTGTTAPRPQAVDGQLKIGPLKRAGLQLVIAWDTENDTHSMLQQGGEAAGETLRQAASSENHNGTVSPTQYDAAAIVLDRNQQKQLVRNNKRGNGLYHVLLHELGHSVGLNHVSNTREVMAPVSDPASPVHYAAGDRLGLHQVGSAGGCL